MRKPVLKRPDPKLKILVLPEIFKSEVTKKGPDFRNHKFAAIKIKKAIYILKIKNIWMLIQNSNKTNFFKPKPIIVAL